MLNLNTLNAHDAIRAIADVHDDADLRALLKQEQDGAARKTVVAAIEAKLKPEPDSKASGTRVLRLKKPVALGAGTRRRGFTVGIVEHEGDDAEVIAAIAGGEADVQWSDDLTDRELANLTKNIGFIEVARVNEQKGD